MKKYFITFEGIDGSGKETQRTMLLEAMRDDSGSFYGDKYSTFWLTREPTRITEPGREISELMRQRDVTKEEATNLFIADRKKHTRMIEDMMKHSHVLCSRYDLSTYAYQMTQGMDLDDLYLRHNYGSPDGARIPDITLVFDLPADVAYGRTSKRDSKKECFEVPEFQCILKDNQDYCIDWLRKKDGRTIIVVDANQPIEDVTEEMLDKLSSYLG